MDKDFDYKGYCEQDLLALCDDKTAHRGFAKWLYWPSEVYSFGKLIREYGFYPPFLPLNVYSNHGTTGYYEQCGIPDHELNNDAFCMFCFDDKNTKYYNENARKQCYTLYSPYVFYRRIKNINMLTTACGTLSFPAHTTPDTENLSNINEYIKQLKSLPEKFQPVCVCLHYHDINKKEYKIYQESNIPVYTVGSPFDIRFSQRFYNILKNFKYTTSNMVGSYTYYSIEMNIPFFIHGKKPLLINHTDDEIKKGLLELEEHEKLVELFDIKNICITNEQKKITESKLGIKDGISRLKMAAILYRSYIENGNLLLDLVVLGKRYWKMKIISFVMIFFVISSK